MADVEIYTRMLCGYCMRAKALLKHKGVAFTEVDASFDAEKRREMIARTGGPATFPQIFIDGRPIGGCDELHALDRKGELDGLLNGGAQQ
jgi:glutaredoxin 3